MKKYRVNEIFYSLQGEGAHAGSAAVFVRFSGCNLKCPFCDTDFKDYEELTADEIVARMKKEDAGKCTLCVLTGGEPTLQYDEELRYALHKADYVISMESNGTIVPKVAVDFLTISPKEQWQPKMALQRSLQASEIKVVVDMDTKEESLIGYAELYPSALKFVQPCDTGYIKNNKEIIKKCVNFILYHPEWKLSLQQQKIINVR